MSDDLWDKKELLALRESYARERAAMNDRLITQRQQDKEHRAQMNQQLAIRGNLEAIKLNHELDEETRERDFADLVREENLRLQSAASEQAIAWRYQKAQMTLSHQQQLEAIKANIMQMTHAARIERDRMTHEEQLEEKILRFKAELALEFGELSTETIEKIVDKLIQQGKV